MRLICLRLPLILYLLDILFIFLRLIVFLLLIPPLIKKGSPPVITILDAFAAAILVVVLFGNTFGLCAPGAEVSVNKPP
jgi:hypothetical protein